MYLSPAYPEWLELSLSTAIVKTVVKITDCFSFPMSVIQRLMLLFTHPLKIGVSHTDPLPNSDKTRGRADLFRISVLFSTVPRIWRKIIVNDTSCYV